MGGGSLRILVVFYLYSREFGGIARPQMYAVY